MKQVAFGLTVLALAACGSDLERVNPERYRAVIATIDSVAIQGPGFRDDRRWAGTALRALGHVLLGEAAVDTSRRMAIDSQLRDLANRTDGIGSDSVLTNPELERAWIRVRGEAFRPAGWFQQPAPPEIVRRPGVEPGPIEFPPGDIGLTAVDQAVSSILEVAIAAQLQLHQEQVGTPGYQRAIEALHQHIGLLERLLVPAPGEPANINLATARTEARESLRYLREFIAAGADTVPGTPAREALEKVAEHAVDARAALDRVE